MNRTRLFTIVFPPEPRDFPFRRSARTALRALHILAAGTLVGGHIFAQATDVLMPWLIAAVLTGTLLLITDLHASFAVLIELRGLVLIGKLVLLCLVAVHPGAAVPLLVAVVLVGAVSSHLPKRYRHRLVLFRDRVVTDHRSG